MYDLYYTEHTEQLYICREHINHKRDLYDTHHVVGWEPCDLEPLQFAKNAGPGAHSEQIRSSLHDLM